MPNEIMVFIKFYKFNKTNLSFYQKDEIQKFCRIFRIKVYKEYKPQISHLIVYPLKDKEKTIQAKRTLKYIYALIDGIWVLSYRCNIF